MEVISKSFILFAFITKNCHIFRLLGLPWWLRGKESACSAGDPVQSLGGEEPLEEGMAGTLVLLPTQRIPWTEEPGTCCPQGRTESDTTDTTKQLQALKATSNNICKLTAIGWICVQTFTN